MPLDRKNGAKYARHNEGSFHSHSGKPHYFASKRFLAAVVTAPYLPQRFQMRPFTRPRTMAFLMRIASVSMLLSGVSFFLPETSINSFLLWCGLEKMPEAAMMRYMLWMAGYLQIGYGIVIGAVARDVVRFQPVIVAIMAVFLFGAPALYWIDAAAGLPAYWSLLDFMCCFLAGGVPLIFWLWPQRRP